MRIYKKDTKKRAFYIDDLVKWWYNMHRAVGIKIINLLIKQKW